jgi:DNA polymerase III subunit epsilon
MREIVLDVETTGLWINAGHRVIEIACIELDRYQPTGRIFHRYINPLLARMPREAFEIHGIPIEFLWYHAPFKAIADSLLEFIGEAQLVIHNAAFDIGFLNNELQLIGYPPVSVSYIDTLSMARTMYPGASNSLDALCRRFKIALDDRAKHGALIDCALLATVYFELIGGKQPLFDLPSERRIIPTEIEVPKHIRAPRPHPPLSKDEIDNFTVMLSQLKNPMWIWNVKNQMPPTTELLDDEIPF